MVRLALAVGVVLVVGCHRDIAPLEDGTSGVGSTHGSSSGAPSTTGLEDMTTGLEDTTTGSSAGGRARFVVSKPFGGTAYTELVLFEYVEGELSPPLSLTPDLPAGGGVGDLVVSDEGTHLGYCIVDAEPGQPCFAIDLTADPPSAAQPLRVGPVLSTAHLHSMSWIEATQTVVFQADDYASEPRREALYSAAFVGARLTSPRLVAQSDPGSRVIDYAMDPERTRVGYVSGPEDGSRNAFIAALDVPSPDDVANVSNLVSPEYVTDAPLLVPGHPAVVYATDDEDPELAEEALWFVDLAGPMPAAPVRIDDPLDDVSDVRGVEVAPDGHALLYWVGYSIWGDVMLVVLSDGVPAPPVPVSQPSDGQSLFRDFGWSPDSRWIFYRAAHEQPDTYDIHLVDASGDSPSEPWLVTGGLVPEGGVDKIAFDSQSHWLYYIAQQASSASELLRVDVSGSEPGPPQRVSEPLPPAHSVSKFVTPSLDWGKILYTTLDDELGMDALFLVDIAGPEPGDALQVNEPLTPNAGVMYRPRFSLDGSVVLYRESGPSGTNSTLLRLVDLTGGSVLTVSDDASDVHPVVD